MRSKRTKLPCHTFCKGRKSCATTTSPLNSGVRQQEKPIERPIRPSVDAPHSNEWACNIGKLVQNFAAIELHTFWWLGALSGDDTPPVNALDWMFKRRVDRVLELISERVSDSSFVRQFSDIWSQSLELAKIRNALVHNPLVFGWLTTDESGAPDFIGIPDVGHLGSKPRISQRIASRTQIVTQINEAHAIAIRLFELLRELDMYLGNTSKS